jgi:hypothetical protein
MWQALRIAKWVFYTLLILAVGAFLHYTLPHHDVVRIAGTYTERQDLNDWTSIFWAQPDDQSGTLTNRDVQFIQAVTPGGRPMVYRNEDTGWRWPPYFKFNTASLQTQAADAVSTKENPRWFVVTHYGWRNQLLSTFPNAVKIRPASGPDETVIPWLNIVILAAIAIVLFMIRRMWLQFRERMVDPAVEAVGDRIERAQGEAEMAGKRAKGWLDSWRRKPPR